MSTSEISRPSRSALVLITLASAGCGAGLAMVPALVEAVMRSAGLDGLELVPPMLCAVIAGVTGMVSAWVGWATDSWSRRLGLLAAALILIATQSLVLARFGIGWEPVSAMLAATVGVVAGGWGAGRSGGAARWFAGRVSRRTRTALSLAQSESFLRPDQREAAVLTCRILNETPLRNSLTAKDFLKLSESFRTAAGRLLLDHGALLHDAAPGHVQAFFGLPLAVENHADTAAAAALALNDVLRQFSLDHMQRDCEPATWGIGVTCGTLTAGLTADRYSVAGDALEQSRWLAGLAGDYFAPVLIDDATYRLAERIEVRPLEILNPPDGAAVGIFQVLASRGGLSEEAAERRDAFRDGIMLLRAGHAADALRRFADARAGLTVPDPVLDRFVAQAEEQTARDGVAPAPPRSRSKRPPSRKVPRL